MRLPAVPAGRANAALLSCLLGLALCLPPGCGSSGQSGPLDRSVGPTVDRPAAKDVALADRRAAGDRAAVDSGPAVDATVDPSCVGKPDMAPTERDIARGCGWGACRHGQWVRTDEGEFGTPHVEECNNWDDDCDQELDENLWRNNSEFGCGSQMCKQGEWVADPDFKQGEEICDGLDNDCNGKIDDIDQVPCMNLACATMGFWECSKAADGSYQKTCKPIIALPVEECDAKDNNCNGKTDEDPFHPDRPLSRPCACGDEREICVLGKWSGCVTRCKEGSERWCDDPQYCHWGKQSCTPDGSWGTCLETTDIPPGCSGDMYDDDCCVQANQCCQSFSNDSTNGQSIGNCQEQCVPNAP
jgi:hypothetical protein